MDADNIKKIKVLFIADKWCAGNFDFGLSEWEGNLWASLKALSLAEVNVFHLDEYYRINGKRGDDALLKRIEDFRPELICLIIYKTPGSDNNVPEWLTLDKIKNIFKIPMIAIWGDLEIKEQVDISKSISSYVKINVATASSAALARIGDPVKYIYMWVPKNPELFNNDGNQRDLDLSYIGTPKEDRLAKIKYLINNSLPVIYTGGERQKHLTASEYANMYKRSKITLSFSRASYSHVINARPFEAMLCGAMLLEQEGFETAKLFIPFVDYVPYTSDKDLLEKAKYYLAHNEERQKIADNGFAKTSKLYSAERFWRLLTDRSLDKQSSDIWGQKLPSLNNYNLSHMPYWRATKLKILDGICSSRPGFIIYSSLAKGVDRGFWISRFFRICKKILKSFLPKSIFDEILEKKRRSFCNK